ELLQGGDVDHAVVQVGVEFRHVPVDEATVRRDGIAGQRGLPLGGYPLADVVEDDALGLVDVDGGGADLLGQPGRLVHVGDEVVHLREVRLGGVDDDVDALAEDVQ